MLRPNSDENVEPHMMPQIFAALGGERPKIDDTKIPRNERNPTTCEGFASKDMEINEIPEETKRGEE